MLIVGINGKIGAGKDTIVDDFMSAWENRVYMDKYRFGDEVKEFCTRHFGLNRDKMYGTQEHKDELTDLTLERLANFFTVEPNDVELFGEGLLSYRKVLQFIGNGMRKVDVNCWVRPTFNKIKASNDAFVSKGWDEDDVVFISDVRYSTEADYIKAKGGVVVRLTRFRELIDHPSETGMDNYSWDFVIDNKNMDREIQLTRLEDIVRYAYHARHPDSHILK